MGICYQGKTLKQAIEDKERLFTETGFCYGLEKLDLVEGDPASFMRFQMRLVAASINARETAKYISANPTSMVMGELLFLLADPEGDVISASHGLVGHIQSTPFILRSIAQLGFEDDPGIKEGDIFSTNDPYYGAPHGSDCFTLVPVLYDGELIAWTVGINHITDVGSLQPGNLSTLSPSTFTDGFLYPPFKTGENFKQHKWWELFWKRRTRTAMFNILDDKMRVAGAVSLHDKALEIVEEFGVDYFRRGLREIIERERRQILQRIRSQAVPGTYRWMWMHPIRYKGVAGKMFPSSDRDWVIHHPCEISVLPDGKVSLDLEGQTSEDDFHGNCYPPGVRMQVSLGYWPMFAYSSTLNTALMYTTDLKIPPGAMFNPQNPFAGTASGNGEAGRTQYSPHICLSYAYFARGFLEECFPMMGAASAYGSDGILADGFRWAGGNMALIFCWSSCAFPFKDGEPAVCNFNPQSDMGEVELQEFIEPTNLTIGRKLVPNYCGHGKFRGGLGEGMCQLIVEPGQRLIMAVFVSAAEASRGAYAPCGGYPGLIEVDCFLHDTNMKELLEKGESYPSDFVEVRQWLKEGKLKAGKVQYYAGNSPNVEVKDGDLFVTAAAAQAGWGDPLERELGLVEKDLYYGWITPDVAATVYGVASNGDGKVKVKESEELRQKMRLRRKEKSLDARDWWRQEREKVLRQDFSNDIYNLYADIVRYDKFGNQFMGMWQVPEDYRFAGLKL